MSDRVKRISLRLNLDNPEEAQAWEMNTKQCCD